MASLPSMHPSFNDSAVIEVLEKNWRWLWCKQEDGSFVLNPGMLYNTHWGYQYLSSVYWSLTMLMKTCAPPPWPFRPSAP
eukprot:996576-Prymnesium_polylepis.4